MQAWCEALLVLTKLSVRQRCRRGACRTERLQSQRPARILSLCNLSSEPGSVS